MGKRESFVIPLGMLSCLDCLTDEQCGKLFKMVRDYHLGKQVSSDDSMITLAFKMIQSEFERMTEISKKRSECGKKGGATKGNQNARKHITPDTQEDVTTSKNEQNQANSTKINQNQPSDNLKQPKTTLACIKEEKNKEESFPLASPIKEEKIKEENTLSVPNGTCPTEVGRASEELTLFNDKEDITLRYNKVIELWNSTCGGLGNIPKVKSLNDERKRKIRLRIKELGLNYMERLNDLFAKISSSPFLKGQMGNWNATFDWVFENETNIQKIFDGNYDAKPVSGNAQENMSNKRYTNAKWNR